MKYHAYFGIYYYYYYFIILDYCTNYNILLKIKIIRRIMTMIMIIIILLSLETDKKYKSLHCMDKYIIFTRFLFCDSLLSEEDVNW